MGTSGFFLLFLLGSMIYGGYVYFHAEYKTHDATQTLVFIVFYPFLLFVAFSFRPLAAWIAVPLIMMGIPWLFAGIYLSKVVKDPSITRHGEFAGFPLKTWAVIMGLSLALGLIFG